MKLKKVGFYFLTLLMMVSFVFAGTGIQAYAATLGDQLLEPESGWKRYDDSDANIIYEGDNWRTDSYSNLYNSTDHYTNFNEGSTLDHRVKFGFIGTKFRIFAAYNAADHSTNIEVYVDGELIESYSEYILGGSSPTMLVYEKLNLVSGFHTVELVNKSDGYYFTLDAIDIDEDGELRLNDSIESPTGLTATTTDSQVSLSWDEVTDADSYNIFRATTSGGPYTTVAEEVYATSYTDTDVTNDTTYYYVITAVNTDGESDNSDEVSATPVDSSNGNKALLRIIMTNGTINEYDLTMDEVDTFIDWYEDRGDGNGDSYYVFIKDYNIGPFVSRTDYIAFDKISQFEVMEYTQQ